MVNDFPTYGKFLGHCVKGYKACPICSKGTHAIRLVNCRKEAYIGHRRFLDNDHPYRRYRKSFNDKQKWGSAPKPMSGEEIYKKVSQVINQFRKKPRNNAEMRKNKKKRKGKGREREREKERARERCQDWKSCTDWKIASKYKKLVETNISAVGSIIPRAIYSYCTTTCT